VSGQGLAAFKVYQHDEYSSDLSTANEQTAGANLASQPGFTKSEAIGQIYTPESWEYPIQLTGLEVLLAATTADDAAKVPAAIEVWVGDSNDAAPEAANPIWTLDIAEAQVAGPPSAGVTALTANTAFIVEFSQDNEGGAPPPINAGKIWVMLRYEAPGQKGIDLLEASQSYLCGAGQGCGCQTVAPLHDPHTTPGVNVARIISPIAVATGNCTQEATDWYHFEDLGVTGDVILRVRAQVSDLPDCTASCAGKECGDDGCGGSCGGCDIGLVCSGGQCVDGGCTPACASKECGDDGCGGVCGTCPQAAPVCGSSGLCEADCAPSCEDKECGDDGCGDVCGTCPLAAPSCEEGLCVADCVPDCEDKECGDDGCGDVCGVCPEAAPVCEAGLCAPEATVDAGATEPEDAFGPEDGGLSDDVGPGELVVTGVSPSWGYADETTTVSITGDGFVEGLTVRVGPEKMGILEVIGDSLVDALVPEGLEPGSYDVIVALPDETTATLPEGFEIRPREATAPGAPADDGCSAGDPGGLALALALFLLWARSTRRETFVSRR
ncbi:MAG: IPT/TIG domain-containing protein, partial [Myxococcota bacterium]|nr:IPT/TIG domain-containing protein [Myxococcota bacterium]